MALQSFNDGNMAWSCPGCAGDKTAHISHEAVQYSGEHMVALPACGCGTQTFLRVHFTDQELATMTDENGNPDGSHATAQRHMDLHQQLQAVGKQYVPPTDAPVVSTAPAAVAPSSEQIRAMILQVLQEMHAQSAQPATVSAPSPQLMPPHDVGEATDPQLPAVTPPIINQP